MESLWGEDFEIKENPKKTKQILNKIKSPKEVVKTPVNIIKSKKIDLQSKLKFIKENVYKILGVYKNDTQVIRDKESLHNYIDKAIKNKVIAIDTETNNSLDPITCVLMGPCIYTPGEKHIYIPLNHVNPETNERLENQLNEEDIKEEFSRIQESDTEIIMHNGKFDYQVIKCTVGLDLRVDWDTMIGAKILDENERSAGLKPQYKSKINPSIEKYSIEHLFVGIEYAKVDPDLFALYAATDAFMTYKLYEYQKKELEKVENEKLYRLFKDVEMPIVKVAAHMELAGVCIDEEYSQRLSKKYHKKLDKLDAEILQELSKYNSKITQWRLSEEATKPINEKGICKNDQLKDPINLSSSIQLAILLYDILKQPVIDKKKPRGTGEEIIEKIDLPICKLILKERGLLKLINTYIDKLPAIVSKKTGRLHANFNQLGAGTGRFSSSDPNLQNIPSHNKEIRMMFKAQTEYKDIEENDNFFEVSDLSEVLTNTGWKLAKDLHVNEIICGEDWEESIKAIDYKDNKIYIYI